MLSDAEIREEMNKGHITIEPFVDSQLGPNSYDVCLGNWFIELKGYRHGKPVFGDFFSKRDGQSITIPVGGTLLGMTKEIVGGTHDIFASMRSRSSTRRNGIDPCAAAGLGDIGYVNHWTVELTSFVTGIIYLDYDEPTLVVGERFAQMVFERTGKPALRPYSGQYNVRDWPLCMIPKDQRDLYSHCIFDDFNKIRLVKDVVE